MRKILHVISSLVILAAGISCVKEIPGQAGHDGNMEVGTEMRTVTFKLNVSSPTQTKAVGIAGLEEDAIHRIDAYEWDYNAYSSWSGTPKHFVLTNTEIQNGTFHVQNPTNARKGYLFYANLSPEIAEKIAFEQKISAWSEINGAINPNIIQEIHNAHDFFKNLTSENFTISTVTDNKNIRYVALCKFYDFLADYHTNFFN